MRVYLASTSTIVAQLLDAGELPAPSTGYAVTPGLQAHYAETDPDADLEDLEYATLTLAARGSLRLIDADPGAWRRRIVLVAEVPDGSAVIRDDLDDGAVQLDQPVALAQLVSAHVDDVDAVHTVAAAAAAIVPADLGDESAQEAVDDAEGNELAWYATQELSGLLELD